MIKYGLLTEFLSLNNYDLISLYISCMVHDYKHPGYNNAFLSLIGNSIAIRYNDKSVLESYHISQAFKLMQSSDDLNIFSGLTKAQFKQMRKRMIGLVLATDMIFHGGQQKYLNEKISTYQIEDGKNKEKMLEDPKKLDTLQQEILEIVIHACDISNPTKTFNLYSYWAEKVVNEFFRQGDKEKELGLPISPGNDRLTCTLPKSQLGFINFVVGPFFKSIVVIFPTLKFLTDNIQTNIGIYTKMKEEMEQKEKEKK
ncbi:MAG: 3',5'-cyclic nucleotide phosphodiesterase [archaeon]|nr:3',5'-cyclic nucleotide phosphodiesterase [archaeon]